MRILLLLSHGTCPPDSHNLDVVLLCLSVDDDQGIHHAGEASSEAFGFYNEVVFVGDAAAVSSRDDIDHMKLIRHIAAALDLVSVDPDAASRPFEHESVVPADLILAGETLTDVSGGAFGNIPRVPTKQIDDNLKEKI